MDLGVMIHTPQGSWVQFQTWQMRKPLMQSSKLIKSLICITAIYWKCFSTGSQLHQNFFLFFRNMTVANKSSMYCMFLFLQIVFEVRLLCTCAACGSWWSICALTHDTLIECFSLWSTLIDCD